MTAYRLSNSLSTTAYAGAQSVDPSSTGGTNMTPYPQSPVVTDPIARGGLIYQYVAWFDTVPASHRIHIAFRTRPDGDFDTWSAWTDQAAAAGIITAIASDSHFSIALGVDPSGRVHAAFRAHGAGDQWMYWMSTVAPTVAGDVEITSTGPTPFDADAVSYPRFLNKVDGTLYFSYRAGAAGGDAQQRLRQWNDGAATWGDAIQLIDWPGSGGDQESPYMQWMFVNPDTGTLHIAWIWARGGVPSTYHTMSYMKSRGTDWTSFTNAFGTAVSLPAGSPSSHPGVVVRDIAEGSGLSLHGGLGADVFDVARIAYLAQSETDATHSSFYCEIPYGGQWLRRTVGDAGEWVYSDSTEYQEVGQPHVLCINQSTYYYYRSTFETVGGEQVIRVRASHDLLCTSWTDPETLVNLGIGDGRPRIDDRAWTAFRRAYMYVQEDMGGADSTTTNYVAEITEWPEAPTMGNLTAFGATEVLKLYRGFGSNPVATHLLALYYGGSELPIGSGAYQKLAIANTVANWPLATLRTKALVATTFSFPVTTATLRYDSIRLLDPSGNTWATQAAAGTGIDVPAGGTVLIDQSGGSDFDITVPTGGFSTAMVEDGLDHFFGGVTLVSPTLTFLSYWYGDPQATGSVQAMVGLRANNGSPFWADVDAGASYNQTTITQSIASGVAYFAESNNASGTTVYFSGAVPAGFSPAPGNPASIAAARWRITAF